MRDLRQAEPTQGRIAIAETPKPTLSLVMFWVGIVLAELAAGLYVLHMYAHLV